ncbi:MAG: proton-conducting transporter membrane subunit, partial [Acidimicrobiia bacterium]|nr:proton-conducting transporter membrane subunit [Acidimicrobiia bacterium]
VAAGGYTAGVFHLFTHAFFKALLFLGAGSVIHGVHSNNMSDMGGLRKYMPTTYWTFVVGSLALAGIIPFAGFFSKDEILGTLGYEGYTVVLWIAIAGAFVTAFYMARTVALTFFGDYKGHGHPHESERSMTVPLVVLAGLSIVAGFVNNPGFKFGETVALRYTGFTEWLGTRVEAPLGDHHPEALDWTLAGLGTAAAVAGIALGWAIFAKDRETQAARDRFSIPVLYPLLRAKYYMDHLALGLVAFIKGPIAAFVNWTNTYVLDGIVNGVGVLTAALGRVVYASADQRGIDGIFNGAAGLAGVAGGALRKLQSGRIQQYAGAVVAGAVALVVGFVVYIN